MKRILPFAFILLFGCAGKEIGTKVLYEGPINGNFVSSDVLVGYFHKVKNCMGIEEEVPYPQVVIYDGDHVVCGDRIKEGCTLTDGKILLPKKTSDFIVQHEFVHYLLSQTTGDLDPGHKSEEFWKCAGRIHIADDVS